MVTLMKILLTLCFLAAIAPLCAANAQEKSNGEIEFRNSCVPCHGPSGKGNGPVAEDLMKRPADLTMLQKNNNGAFPYNRVVAVIDGRFAVSGHGDREMPVWGTQFLEESTEKFGSNAAEVVTQERIHELANYIETLQQ
jgi:mono/diheme cytochrome c family protein